MNSPTSEVLPAANASIDPNDEGSPRIPVAAFLDTIRDDWTWAFAERDKGTFDEYEGRFIAVLNRQVVGADKDQMILREETAARLNVDTERLLILYVDEPTFTLPPTEE